jgi:membrane peptidoglycan carboxypeptidase
MSRVIARRVFNRVTQARRQPGSGFKPFVYAAAFDKGYTLASIVIDAPIVIDETGEIVRTSADRQVPRLFNQPDSENSLGLLTSGD